MKDDENKKYRKLNNDVHGKLFAYLKNSVTY